MELLKMDVRMLLLSYLREARLHSVRMTGMGTPDEPYVVEFRNNDGWLQESDVPPGSPLALICSRIADVMMQNSVRDFSRFQSPPEKPLTVADAIEKLKVLPPNAELRVTELGADGNTVVNVPARDILFEVVGPLLYVEVV